MESRFGIKDFFLFLLLILLIVVVLLAMEEYDRQYQLIRHIDQQGRDQLRELVAIHNALDRGVSLGGPATQTSATITPADDPFPRLRQLRKEGKYDQGDWLVMDLPAHVEKLTALTTQSLYGMQVVSRVLETLAYHDPVTLKYVPLLATNWQQSDDGLSVTFQLRHDVTFSDGSPMTADDVVYSFDLAMNPALDAAAYRQQFDRCQSCTKLGPYEVQFKLKEPFYLTFDNLGTSLYIIPKAFYSKYTIQQINDSVGLLMGSGPYRLPTPTDWRPNAGRIELLRNDRYWGLAPSFDRLVYNQVEQESTSVVQLINGDTDLIALTPPTYKQLLGRPDVLANTQHYNNNTILSGYIYLGWNQVRNGKPTIFADKRVRQAMTMLTNRKGLCQSIMLGYATPAPGPYPVYSDMHDPALADWEYDPQKAKALLKEAGYEDRGHGVLERADGTQLSFKLSYGAKNETFDRIAKYIVDDYASAGVHMELDPMDFSILLQRINTRDVDATALGWGGGTIEDDIYQMFDSSQIAGDGDDYVSYKDPEFDKTVELARRTLDPDARRKLWHECERILHEDQPYTFLYDQQALRFMAKRIAGYQVTKQTGSNFVQEWSVPMPWYVPGPMQKYH